MKAMIIISIQWTLAKSKTLKHYHFINQQSSHFSVSLGHHEVVRIKSKLQLGAADCLAYRARRLGCHRRRRRRRCCRRAAACCAEQCFAGSAAPATVQFVAAFNPMRTSHTHARERQRKLHSARRNPRHEFHVSQMFVEQSLELFTAQNVTRSEKVPSDCTHTHTHTLIRSRAVLRILTLDFCAQMPACARSKRD
ncbi:unnamed protein product [Trichogramma brassicae]|uniref:Uncharacterized protein n=1 Tax=Trichogramma brassicae TaxID=86971 RepID=A0A6H5I9X0_9HYME|nr:unnamed protein product [Trichogramma brassicae]